MNYAVLLIHDTRDDYLHRTLESAHKLVPHFEDLTLVEVHDRHLRLGFAGAIAEGWARIGKLDPQPEFVFHLEGDFEFREPVPLAAMGALLRACPQIAQVSLKRQPWNEYERAAGGIVEADPDGFIQRSYNGFVYTEHRRYFTTNPSLYRSTLCERSWPPVSQSEGMFTHALLADEPDTRFAIWGEKYAAPTVDHIGFVRAGRGY